MHGTIGERSGAQKLRSVVGLLMVGLGGVLTIAWIGGMAWLIMRLVMD